MKKTKGNRRRRTPLGETLGFAAGLVGSGLLATVSPFAHAAGGDTPAGPEAPLPFDRVEAPPVRRGQAPASIAQELPDLSGESWRMAPIRWGGTSASTLNSFKENNGIGTRSVTEMLTLRTASHIYQPWFAQVNGNLGVLSGTTRRTLPSNFSAPSDDVRTTSLTYGGSLNLFPLSRFPLQAYLDKSDSRASGNAIGTQFTSTRLGLRQSYRPPIGNENYAVSYDRSAISADIGHSVVNALQGNYSASLADHSLSANTRFSRNTGGINGEASRLFSAFGSHVWRVEDGLSVSSTANVSDQQIRYLSSGILSMNNNRLLQANSTFTWLPDEDLPLTVIGGANLLSTETTTDTGSSQLSNLGGFAGLTYRFSNRLTGNGNLQILQSNSGSTKRLLAGGNGALSYSGEPLVLGNFNYNWNAGTNIGFQSVTGGASNQTVSGQFGHSLNRSIVFSPENAVSLNLGQGVSLASSSQAGASTTLSHSGGVSWRLGYTERITGMFSAVLSDNLSTGQYSGHYRTFSLNGNGLAQLSRRASITANANISWSQQQQQQPQNGQPPQNIQQLQLGSQIYNTNQSQWNGSASLGYNHFNPFGVANLTYSANVVYSSSQVNQRIVNGDPNALSWQVSRALQQRALYRIGRLNFQALATLATVNGKKNASIFFQVSRDFGDF